MNLKQHVKTLEEIYDMLLWSEDDPREALLGYIKDVQERIEQELRAAERGETCI